MKIRAAFGWLVLVTACGGVVSSTQRTEPPPDTAANAPVVDLGIPRRAADDVGDLTFPVVDEERRDRGPLPDRFRPAVERRLRLVYPDVDDGHAQIEGRTLELRFNQPMRGAKPRARPERI
jgi:hypothetical protein